MCVHKELWQLQLCLPNTTMTKCYTLAWFFKSCYQNPQTDLDFSVTLNWTKDLHLKCFCLMPLYKQVFFMLCRVSLFQQLLNYFANFALWTKFTNRNCCLQNSIFFCSLFCQSKQKNSWTSFSSVHSLKKLLLKTDHWKVLKKIGFSWRIETSKFILKHTLQFIL